MHNPFTAEIARQLAALTSLDASNRNIANLTDTQYCTHLCISADPETSVVYWDGKAS